MKTDKKYNFIFKKWPVLLIFIVLLSNTLPAKKSFKQIKTRQKYPMVQIRDTEVRFLQSKILNQKYEIDISFPKGYHKEKTRYPVIYALDAEYNFGCVSYITRRLIKNKEIPKVIVVGIAYNTSYNNFYKYRTRDLTPKFKNQKIGGRADLFALFFKKELFPFINQNYRSNPLDTTLVGHSLGGLFGIYVLFNNPLLFNRIICLSPSIWYCKKKIYKYVEDYARGTVKPKVRFYTAVGAEESTHMVQDWKTLFSKLNNRFSNVVIKARLMEDETHRSIFPYGYTKGLKFIFNNF